MYHAQILVQGMTLCEIKILSPGLMWPLCLLILVFRVFSFSLIVTFLRYYSIPVYTIIFLLAIFLGRFWNKDNKTFVIKGFKSLLFMGRLFVLCSCIHGLACCPVINTSNILINLRFSQRSICVRGEESTRMQRQ